jgi:hypothetical protein
MGQALSARCHRDVPPSPSAARRLLLPVVLPGRPGAHQHCQHQQRAIIRRRPAAAAAGASAAYHPPATALLLRNTAPWQAQPSTTAVTRTQAQLWRRVLSSSSAGGINLPEHHRERLALAHLTQGGVGGAGEGGRGDLARGGRQAAEDAGVLPPTIGSVFANTNLNLEYRLSS